MRPERERPFCCYGYLLKYNIPAPKGSQDASIVPPPAKKPEIAAAPAVKDSVEPKSKRRASGRSRSRSPRPAHKKRDARNRRSRSPCRRRRGSSATLADKGVYEERMSPWLAGEDTKCSLRDKCKNCYIGLGTHVPKHEWRSCKDLGNACYLTRRARDYECKRARHWARDCPNRPQLNARPRRTTSRNA